MAVPKRRVCHARKKLRTQHINRLRPPTLVVDRQTKSVHRPHHIDLRTGRYRGQQVLYREEEGAEPGSAAAPTSGSGTPPPSPPPAR